MTVFHPRFDKEAETAWLNQKAAEGWNMTGFFAGFTTFEKCQSGECQYQIDVSDRFGSVSKEYRDFMESMDVTIIACWGPWVFLRRKATAEPFELYTDDDSQLEHLTKVRRLFKIAAIIEIICFTIAAISASVSGDNTALVCSLVLALLVGLFCYMVYVNNMRINRIRQNRGELEEQNRKGNLRFMAIGWLFYWCGVALQHSDSTLLKEARIVTTVAACICFGISLGLSAKNKRK